jgi:hypothetical protein
MKEVCEYNVIKDGSFNLEANEDKTYTFNLPNDAKIERYSVLFYKLDPSSSASNLKYDIEINSTKVESGSLTGGVMRSKHEAVQANILTHGSNSIQYEVKSGSGSVTFSDVILYYRRDV